MEFQREEPFLILERPAKKKQCKAALKSMIGATVPTLAQSNLLAKPLEIRFFNRSVRPVDAWFFFDSDLNQHIQKLNALQIYHLLW